MVTLLAQVPLWLWLVWLGLIFLTAVVLAPRRRTAPRGSIRRLLRVGGQLLLGAAMVLVRAETVPLATLLAAVGGALYGNASGAGPRATSSDTSSDAEAGDAD